MAFTRVRHRERKHSLQRQNPNAPSNPDMIFECEVGPVAL